MLNHKLCSWQLLVNVHSCNQIILIELIEKYSGNMIKINLQLSFTFVKLFIRDLTNEKTRMTKIIKDK